MQRLCDWVKGHSISVSYIYIHLYSLLTLYIQVVFAPLQEFGNEFKQSYRVQNQYTTSAIQIQLLFPSSTFPLFSYYAVADLRIEGQCSCYGYSSVCVGPVSLNSTSNCPNRIIILFGYTVTMMHL